MRVCEIYVDGISLSSPGPGGFGVIIADCRGNTIVEISQPLSRCTPDQAAFRGYKRALEEIKKRKLTFSQIHTSNQILVHQVQGIYRIMDPILKQLRRSVKQDYSHMKHKIILDSSEGTRRAAQLAQGAAERAKKELQFKNVPVQMVSTNAAEEDDRNAEQDIQRSAGGVVYKKDGNRMWVCLIAKKNFTVWALPKGRVDEGEKPEETAVREVMEETGNLAKVEAKLDEIDYFFYWKDNNTFYHKFVYFYLMELVEEDVRPRDDEADIVNWLPPHEALNKLTYINEKDVMKKALGILEAM